MELVRLFTLMVMFTKEVTRMGKDVDKDCVSLARLVLFTKESGKRTNHLVTVGFFSLPNEIIEARFDGYRITDG